VDPIADNTSASEGPPPVAELDGARFAIVLVDIDRDDHSLLIGTARRDGDGLVLDWSPERRPFPIPTDTLHRVKPVTSDDAEFLDLVDGADYLMYLGVGPLPDDVDPGTLERIDLHDDDRIDPSE
jgi:hypothetical protein